MKLLTKEELLSTHQMDEFTFKRYIKEGMPHLKLGMEYRFIEEEANKWIESYKPKQEKLEEAYRDDKGRSLKDYVSLENILDVLRISKEKLYRLCLKGMPFAKIGKKRFFHIEDILAYFRRGNKEENESVESRSRTATVKPNTSDANAAANLLKNVEDATLYVIDGSFDFKNNQCGSGIVKKENGAYTGYTFGRIIPTDNTIICEYLAILDALSLIKKEQIPKAVIITDQVKFVEYYHNGTFHYYKWMNQPTFKPYFIKLQQLCLELKDRISFYYVDRLTDSHQNPMYKQAHKFSRVYSESIVENMELDENCEEHQVTFNPESETQKTISISYVEKKKSYHYYNVNVDGKKKKVKLATQTAMAGVFNLVHSYVKTLNHNRLTIRVHPIPSFEKDMKTIFHSAKRRLPMNIKNTLKMIERKCDFHMADDYQTYIRPNQENTKIA